MKTSEEFANDAYHPLDKVEDILSANNWDYYRSEENEIFLKVTGKNCTYRILFAWDESLNALQFCCQYDLSINEANMGKAARTIMILNSNLWMGHFGVSKDTRLPSFRHTCLMRGMDGSGKEEYIEDLVDLALSICERYYSLFYFLSHANDANEQTLSLALMEAEGES